MPEIYPIALPQPKLTPYTYSVDSGLLHSPIDTGATRHRRLFDVMPHEFELVFIIPLSQLFSWQDWVNRYAYSFIQIDLVSWLSNNQQCSPHYVRFTSNIELSMLDKGVMQAKVKADLSPATVANYNAPPENNWIIAGSPALPSLDVYIAGTPGAPSADFVLAGNPPNPSL